MGEQEILKNLSPETQKLIYEELKLKQDVLSRENARLREVLRQKNQIIDTLTTEGLNIAHLAPIQDCAKALDLSADQLASLREQGRHDEFLKVVYRKYHHDMDIYSQMYSDKQLDMNGVFMYEKLNDAKEFFRTHRDPMSYSAEDIKLHTEMADQLNDGIEMVFEWAKIGDRVNAIREATIDLTMWYGIESLKSTAEKKMKVAEEYKAADDVPEEEEPVPVKAPAAPQRVDMVKKLTDEIMGKEAPPAPKPEPAREEPPEAEFEPSGGEPADMPAPTYEEPKKKRKN